MQGCRSATTATSGPFARTVQTQEREPGGCSCSRDICRTVAVPGPSQDLALLGPRGGATPERAEPEWGGSRPC